MSTPLDDALATLGLRPDADARSVRRAYAQQLKQLDQATQAKEFQALREAYELALHVINRREADAARAAQAVAEPEMAEAAVTAAEAAPEPMAPAPVAPAGPAPEPATASFLPPDSDELARAVFQAFSERAAAGFKEEADANAALQDALADDRLLNLEARTLFELRVAHLIMNGWKPGHEFLFGPACEVFSWEKDRAHLRVFGQLGAGLDAAINEKLIFFRQSPKDFNLQRNVIRRLRQPEMPSTKLRRADLPIAQMLVQRYPNWLRLVTSQANINTWFHDLPEAPAPSGAVAQAEPVPAPQRGWKPAASLKPWLIAAFVVFMLLKVISGLQSPPQRQLPPLTDIRHASDTYQDRQPIRTWEPSPQPVMAGNTSLGMGSPGEIYGLQPPSTDPAPSHRQPPPAAYPPQRIDTGTISTTYQAPALPRQAGGLAGGTGSSGEIYGLQPPSIDAELSAHRRSTAASASQHIDTTTMDTAFQAANVPRQVRELAQGSVRLGHVTFAKRGDHVVVEHVGERTRQSFSTLWAGDRLLRCMSGTDQSPLVEPADVRRCDATANIGPEAGTTVYMFSVVRYGESMPASLTLRDAPDTSAGKPSKAIR